MYNFSENCFFFCMRAYNNFVQETWLKMVIKEGTLEAKKVFWRRDWLGFCAPLVVNWSSTRVGQQERVMAFQEPCSLKVALVFVLFSPPFLSFAYSPGLVYGWLLNDLQVYISRDQTAVDAAGSQSSLQSAFLFLRSQDCDDGLVEHRLQALLGQSWTFHIATCTDLMRRKERRDHQTQYDKDDVQLCDLFGRLSLWLAGNICDLIRPKVSKKVS